MSDPIDRRAALDALCAVCGKACDKSEFVYNAPQDEQVILCPEHYCLCTLPSAQPWWIPTSERLPKPNEYENDVRKYYLVQNEYGDMMVCSWHGSFWMQMYRNTPVKDKVVAWMPLPKPYREGEQE